jgi:gamma-glutamyltranspeptidase/glutathione hydrolase
VPAPAKPLPNIDRGVFLADSEQPAAVAHRAVEAGGNAFDVAVAMAFTAAVTQPSACGLGGGGFALVWDGGKATVIDFRETAPGGLRLRDHLSPSPAFDKRGVMVGVPGFVAGMAALHARGAALPWRDDLEGARKIAAEGFAVEWWLERTISWSKGDLARAGAADLMGAGASIGDARSNAALAKTLAVIAEKGAPAFYRGPLADDLVRSARAAGSTIVAADLAKYAVEIREPLRVPWGAYEVLVPPPPSGGGVVLAQELLTFSPDDVAKLVPGSGRYVHLLAEGLREAGAERRAKVGDPAFTRADTGEMLDAERLRGVRRGLRENTTREPDRTLIEDGGTCSFIAWDDHDRVVVLSTSLGSMFGSKVLTKGGYFLGDALTDFAHDALAAKVATKGPNFPRAGARPVSSMTPTLLLEGGEPALAVTATGGARVPGAILQMLHRTLVSDLPLEDATTAPLFHAPASGGLVLDERLLPIADDLRRRGEAIDGPRPIFVRAAAVRRRTASSPATFDAGTTRGGGVGYWRAAASTAARADDGALRP